MSELSEEEKLINYLNSIDITRVFYDNPPHDNHVGIGKALQGLLDLYQKEKEKNKELKDKIKRKIKIRKEEKAECRDSIEANLILREIYVLEELLEERK